MFSTSERKNIYPCLSWVKAGCAKQRPDKVELDKDELKKIIEETQEKLAESEILSSEEEEGEKEDEDDQDDDVAAAVDKAKKIAEESFQKKVGSKRKMNEAAKTEQEDSEDDDVLKRYGLDDYDDDDFAVDHMHGIGSLTPFASAEDDPYITIKDDDDSDEEDFVLQSTDNLLALGRVTAEAAVLDVHVYNGEMTNLFIHHDYVLPTLPLVLEWMDYDVADGDKGNFLAMGTMEPDISIWDLDVVDSLEPVAVLKGCKPKKKKKMKKVDTVSGGHTDAVLDLSWNKHVRNVLASASADNTVCLWDLSSGSVVSQLKHHKQQVQCVAWHPVETQLLLTGSFDQNVTVVDCRSPDDGLKSWALKGEVERAIWNHFSPFQCLASTDQGMLYCMDTRKDKPLYELSAHDQAVSGLSLSSQIAGLLVTTSSDKVMKVWDIVDDKPSLVLSRNLNLDILHCCECNPDHPFVFAFGGNKDFKVWDIRESAAVRKHFLGRMPSQLAAECENDEADLLPEAEEAMENLNMEDEEDAREEEEMLAGDRGEVKKKSGDESSGKKKRKKKKKKNEN